MHGHLHLIQHSLVLDLGILYLSREDAPMLIISLIYISLLFLLIIFSFSLITPISHHLDNNLIIKITCPMSKMRNSISLQMDDLLYLIHSFLFKRISPNYFLKLRKKNLRKKILQKIFDF